LTTLQLLWRELRVENEERRATVEKQADQIDHLESEVDA
jgi:hypothetical protein